MAIGQNEAPTVGQIILIGDSSEKDQVKSNYEEENK